MDIIHHINWVDILIIIIVLRTSYVAFQEGLSHEIFPVLTGLGSIIICLHYYKRAGASISQGLFGLARPVADFIAFLILAAGTALVFRLIKVILDKIITVTWNPIIEKAGGLVFGVARASITASIVIMTLALLPLPYLQWSIRDKSLTGVVFLKIGPAVYQGFSRLSPSLMSEKGVAEREALMKDLLGDKKIVSAEKARPGQRNE